MNKTKIIAAVVLLPIFIWLIGWGPPWLILAAVVVIAAGMGGAESARLVFGEGDPSFRFAATVFSIVACLAAATGSDMCIAPTVVLIFLASLGVAGLMSTDLSTAATRAAKLVFVAIYPGLLSGYVVALKGVETGYGHGKLLFVLFALVWINDAGAFFVGSAMGKKKLAPRISPGKTWEGSIGGFAATVILGALIGMFSRFTFWQGLTLGVVLGVLGPIGDLVESALKRGAGVKDSGKFLPGHGGVLDRIDSVIFCAPILYYYIVLAIHCAMSCCHGAHT
jgi:phosphatidate cytidylyltransferase